jgi:hypothetical protein
MSRMLLISILCFGVHGISHAQTAPPKADLYTSCNTRNICVDGTFDLGLMKSNLDFDWNSKPGIQVNWEAQDGLSLESVQALENLISATAGHLQTTPDVKDFLNDAHFRVDFLKRGNDFFPVVMLIGKQTIYTGYSNLPLPTQEDEMMYKMASSNGTNKGVRAVYSHIASPELTSVSSSSEYKPDDDVLNRGGISGLQIAKSGADYQMTNNLNAYVQVEKLPIDALGNEKRKVDFGAAYSVSEMTKLGVETNVSGRSLGVGAVAKVRLSQNANHALPENPDCRVGDLHCSRFLPRQ